MFQLSEKADEVLNNSSDLIEKSEQQIAEATKRKDEAWEEVFEIFAEFGRDGKEAQFIANNGYTLVRQQRTGAPKLDEEKLKAMIFQKYSKTRAKEIWNQITEPKIDDVKLETAVQLGNIDAGLVEECITPGSVTYARIRRKWSKEDKEKAVIYGTSKE